MRRKRKPGTAPRTDYKDKLWRIFSRYIRLRDNGICFTCGIRKHYKEMQAGHFIHNVLDFDEMNVNAQCVQCNKFKHGMGQEYAIRLLNKYGQDKVLDLHKRAKLALAGERVEDDQYEAKIASYSALADELEQKYVF